MNQYPAWKYALIGLVLLFGLLYALPNLFGEDPAVQITSARGFALTPNIETVIEDTLVAEQIGHGPDLFNALLRDVNVKIVRQHPPGIFIFQPA